MRAALAGLVLVFLVSLVTVAIAFLWLVAGGRGGDTSYHLVIVAFLVQLIVTAVPAVFVSVQLYAPAAG